MLTGFRVRIGVAGPGPPTTLTLTPSATLVAQGGALTFSVTGADALGNDVGDISSQITLSSDVASDVVTGLSVAFPHASPHTITATGLGLSATVVVEVIPTLAATGVQPEALLWVGLLPLLLGFELILWKKMCARFTPAA